MLLASGCSLAPKSFKGIRNAAPLFRARAIPLGRGLPDAVVIPSLIQSLDDDDQVVRLTAFTELKKRTGQDFGFVPVCRASRTGRGGHAVASVVEGQDRGLVYRDPGGSGRLRRRHPDGVWMACHRTHDVDRNEAKEGPP